jgi:hypothetical protein
LNLVRRAHGGERSAIASARASGYGENVSLKLPFCRTAWKKKDVKNKI